PAAVSSPPSRWGGAPPRRWPRIKSIIPTIVSGQARAQAARIRLVIASPKLSPSVPLESWVQGGLSAAAPRRDSEEEALQERWRGAASSDDRQAEGECCCQHDQRGPRFDDRGSSRDHGEGLLDRLHRMIGQTGTGEPNEHHHEQDEEDADDQREALPHPRDAQAVHHSRRIAPRNSAGIAAALATPALAALPDRNC